MEIVLIVVIALFTHFIVFAGGYYICKLESNDAMRQLAQQAYERGFEKAKTLFSVALREF